METHNSMQLAQNIKDASPKFDQLKQEIKKVIVGNESIITLSCIGLLANGHILLEGVPGVAKTTLIKTLAQALGLSFSRIQFTPDLLPTDIIGTLIYNPKSCEFNTKKGPLFAHLVLADEINRSPAKVQSALLEAMQEHQVTIGSTSYSLPNPFLVFATQNPIENEGTYQLPEAQVDRFMFKLLLTYPSVDQEREMLNRTTTHITVHPVVSEQDILSARHLVNEIHIDERLKQYILDIVFATRFPSKYKLEKIQPLLQFGASPRASIALLKASKTYAFLQGRHFVVPEDIKFIAKPILRHRLILTYQAMAENISVDHIIQTIIDSIFVP
ncbi:MoxR family ATPase [Candidatus Dependentiae bacterium]|nr:MoxR family ATPase [Candidatus Dependentiae bacterium]